MRSQLHPPPGVTAAAGRPAGAGRPGQRGAVVRRPAPADADRRPARGRAGAAGGVPQRPARALVPLIPIALATGWSALILFVIGIPLNPMSATLGALVIAISTEFSVLLSERLPPGARRRARARSAALARTYRSTGAAVLASGITAIAGFGVLVFSNITMLRDFGFVTLIDLTVSLAGVLLVLPAVLALPSAARWRAPGRSAARGGRRAAAAAPAPAARRRERPGRAGGPTGPAPRPRPARALQRLDPDLARRPRRCRDAPAVREPDAAGTARPTPTRPRSARRAARHRRAARPVDRHAPLPVDDRDLRARARGRISVYQFATHGVGDHRRAGRAAAALLRGSAGDTDLNGDANLNPPCTPRRPRPAGAQHLPAGAARPAGAGASSSPASASASARSTRCRRCRGSSRRRGAVRRGGGQGSPHGDRRAGPLTPLDDPGRLRPRRRGRRSCTGSTSVRWSSSRTVAASSRDRLIGDHWETAAALAPQVAGAGERRVAGGRDAMATGAAADRVRRAAVAAEFPGLRLRWLTVPARRRPQPARRCAPRCATLSNRYRGAERRRDADPADPARLPDLLSPDRARSRRRPDPQRGGGGGAAAARRVSLGRPRSPTPA